MGVDNKDKWEAAVEENQKTTTPDTLLNHHLTHPVLRERPKALCMHTAALCSTFWDTLLNRLKTIHTSSSASCRYAHIYERSMNYEFQSLGISIYYAENMGTIARDLKDIQATGFVPFRVS